MTYFEMFAMFMGTVIVPILGIYMRNTKVKQDEATSVIREQVGLLSRLVQASDSTVDQLGLINALSSKIDLQLDNLTREYQSTVFNVNEISKQLAQVENKLDSLKEASKDVKDSVGDIHRRLDTTRV